MRKIANKVLALLLAVLIAASTLMLPTSAAPAAALRGMRITTTPTIPSNMKT